MAIYHFSAKVIGRGTGRSAVAAAAYRSASRLEDERLGRAHDFINKPGVVHSEVMLPEGAPERMRDREALWNEVEAIEKRKDAQLAREVEFAIPRELNKEQGIALAREFVAREFVAREFVDRGMVADLNVHWDIGADGESKPHTHVMLAMREVGPDGFGAKVREWNATALLQQWRERWAEHANERLRALGIAARIDHRSHDARGIELEPQHKIGAAGARRLERGEDAERADDHVRIARANGATIVAHPEIGLDALTRNQATFTRRDMAMFAHRHSDGKEQFDRVLAAMRGSDQLLALGRDGRGDERFTTASMLSAEEALVRNAAALAATKHHVSGREIEHAVHGAAARGFVLGREQRAALDHVARPASLSLVVGYAGSGKSTMLGLAREAWEAAGYTVRGTALSGIAAENLEGGSGIASRTIASLEHAWARDRDRLTSRDVLVLDEAGMVGTRQLQRVLAEAADAGAKVAMVGDAQQLQSIEAGAAFRLLAERHGAAEISDVRRQAEPWMREATRMFATGRTGEAITAYSNAGMVHAGDTRDAARTVLIDRWDADRRAEPAASRIILTHMNKEVVMLNQAARERMATHGELGQDATVQTERGVRHFAENDRILFLKNERELGVKNGSLGTVERAARDSLAVRLDDGRKIDVDLKSYNQVDYGYAVTVHKTQGMTVDRTYVLATPGMDAHSTYVALSRHRAETAVHYGRDDFADETQLRRTLARERPKDMALDYDGRPGPTSRDGRGAADSQAAVQPRPSASRDIPTEQTASAVAPTSEKAGKESAGAAAAPSQQDRASKLRETFAALGKAPRRTAEQVRAAFADSAKTQPTQTRDRDYGAER
jgi:Ti-type conjugative transfer relaxase TraA